MKEKMLKKLLIVLTGLLFVGLLVSACSPSASELKESKPAYIEQPSETLPPAPTEKPTANKAPDFEAITMTGEKLSLSSLRGKVVILNFWATWCPPCRDEIPELNSFYEEYKNRVVFLGIEIMESREEVEQFLQEQRILYPIILDSEQKTSISNLYRISLVPTTYVIDEQGAIITVIMGSTTFESLSSYLP
ncbi:MAG: TlpA family protein disulfide reductase [bacterium]